METYTLTFGDQAENHAGMQKIGKAAARGFGVDDLMRAKEWFEKKGVEVRMYELGALLPEGIAGQTATLLVAKGGAAVLCDFEAMFEEQRALEKDKKAYMRGRVVNKRARYNLCFGETAQAPDYDNKKGTIVAYDAVPHLARLRRALVDVIGEGASDLVVEGNYYHNVDSCYIGYHGDGERRKVIAVRMGASFPLHYQWYLRSKPIGQHFEVDLAHGDLYIMSEKAVGTDWLLKTIPTLRHAAGLSKNLKVKAVKTTDDKS